jgi:hypothetical protein
MSVKICYGCNQLKSFDYVCVECKYVRDFCNNCNTVDQIMNYFSMHKNQKIFCKKCEENLGKK